MWTRNSALFTSAEKNKRPEKKLSVFEEPIPDSEKEPETEGAFSGNAVFEARLFLIQQNNESFYSELRNRFGFSWTKSLNCLNPG